MDRHYLDKIWIAEIAQRLFSAAVHCKVAWQHPPITKTWWLTTDGHSHCSSCTIMGIWFSVPKDQGYLEVGHYFGRRSGAEKFIIIVCLHI